MKNPFNIFKKAFSGQNAETALARSEDRVAQAAIGGTAITAAACFGSAAVAVGAVAAAAAVREGGKAAGRAAVEAAVPQLVGASVATGFAGLVMGVGALTGIGVIRMMRVINRRRAPVVSIARQEEDAEVEAGIAETIRKGQAARAERLAREDAAADETIAAAADHTEVDADPLECEEQTPPGGFVAESTGPAESVHHPAAPDKAVKVSSRKARQAATGR